MEILFVIAVYTAALIALKVGKFSGEAKRRSTVADLKSDSTHVPAYQLIKQFEPLELELFFTGVISDNGVAGQLAQLNQSRSIYFDLTKEEIRLIRPKVMRTEKSDILYSILSRDQLTRRPRTEVRFNELKQMKAEIKHETLSSLRRKNFNLQEAGRLDPQNPPNTASFSLIFLATLPIILLIVLVLAWSISDNEELFSILLILGPLSALLSIVGVVVWIIRANFKNEFNKKTVIIEQVSQQHGKDWEDVQRFYKYLEVSGADQFTPNYEDLNLSEMDQLYPYWVALGFDKKIVKLFK